MTDVRDQVDRVLGRVGAEVTRILQASGWMSLSLRNYAMHSFTRDLATGLMATAEIVRISGSVPSSLPAKIRVTVGVGYRPALDMLPLLTLPVDADLVPMQEGDERPTLTMTVSGDDDAAVTAAAIAAMIENDGVRFAERFADVDAIDRFLQELEQHSTGTDESYQQLLRTRRLVLLTSADRLREARTLLDTFEPHDRDDRRFQRQLTRWLDADRHLIPPVEETLALLPVAPVRTRWSIAEDMARAAAKKEATDSVRAQARGKSVDELVMLLATAYAQRDIDVSAASLAPAAVAMALQQQPFGRARSALRGLRMLASVGADTLSRARGGFAEDPSWLQPPGRASFRIDGIPGRKATVALDPGAAEFIARVVAEAPARYGFIVRVSVWFDAHESGVDAYIGEHRVGTVEHADSPAFDAVLRAAAIFDEAPVVRGQVRTIDGTPITLEVPLPAGLA